MLNNSGGTFPIWIISTTGIKTFLAPASLAIWSASGNESVPITVPPIENEPKKDKVKGKGTVGISSSSKKSVSESD